MSGALTVIVPFALLAFKDFLEGGMFANYELNLAKNNLTFDSDWKFVSEELVESGIKQFLKEKNVSENDLESKLEFFKGLIPESYKNEKMNFSKIDERLEEMDVRVKFLFKVAFAQNTDLGKELSLDVWCLIGEQAKLINSQSV